MTFNTAFFGNFDRTQTPDFMNNSLVISLFIFFLAFGIEPIIAQSYMPLSREGARWIVMRSSTQPSIEELLYEYYILGDTSVDHINYKKVYQRDLVFSYGPPPYEPDGPYGLAGFIRDDTLKEQVYAIKFQQDFFSFCPEGEEYLMFDFSYQVGDTVAFCTYSPELYWDSTYYDHTIQHIENGFYYGVNSKEYLISDYAYRYYEGIGSEFGLFETMFIAVKKDTRGVSFVLQDYCPDGNCDLVVGSKDVQKNEIKLTARPNPFTASTTVEYLLNQPEKVVITFYNQFGEQVDKINQKQSTGPQKFMWNPQNLPAGIYYFLLQAGGRVASGKVVKM
jgi:hypothetical protein